MYSTRARAQIITRLKRHCLDPSREWRGADEQVSICGPYRSLDDRLVTRVTKEIAQQRYATEAERSEWIGDAGDRHEWTKDPWCHAPHPSNGFGWSRLVRAGGSFGDDEIGAPLEALDQLGQMFRLVGEVGLHDDHPVAARIARATRHLPRERIEGTRVANVLLTADDREWKDVRVALERFARAVGAAVVEYEDLVFPRVLLKHLANAPQQETDGGRFVVRWNADVQQRASSEAAVR